MDRRISKLQFLLCVWRLPHAGELLVAAQPTVTATILTPEADRREGGMVHMRCVATNLEPDHIVEWRIENTTLRWGSSTIGGADGRFMFETMQTGDRETTQEFNITDLQQMDNDEYICNVQKRLTGGGYQIIASASVTLRVYSPSESFPICSPDGPIAVYNGTQLNMRCSSDTVNHVAMVVSPIPTLSNRYTWTPSIISGIVSRSLNLTVTVSDDNLAFECVIPSVTHTGRNHSCTIGPITAVTGVVTGHSESVTTTPTPTGSSKPQTTLPTNDHPSGSLNPHSTLPTNDHPSGSSNPHSTLPTNDHPSASAPWIATFIVSFTLLAASSIINILLGFRMFKLKRLNRHLSEKITCVTRTDPYMELQPTDDRNREYMEPEARETTTAQHTYYQTIEAEKEHPDDDYEVTG